MGSGASRCGCGAAGTGLPRRITAPYVPEEAGAWALPQGEFGLDVIAVIGQLRYREHRSVPEIHQALRERGVDIAERSVTVLLHRYEELVALRLSDPVRLRERLAGQGGVILALDGLQPDVGHEVLWVLRDVVSGEVLLARSLLGATEDDLAPLLEEVRTALSGERPEDTIPIRGVISDGQHSIRQAVAQALPGVPHQLCQFHYLREAARPIFEADRHAKKELKKELKKRCAACARLSARSRGRADPRPRPRAATAWRSAARSPTTGAHRLRPLASSSGPARSDCRPPLSAWSEETLRDRPTEPTRADAVHRQGG